MKDDADQIGKDVAAGLVTKEQAVAHLVRLDWDEADAKEQVFIACGGDDVVPDTAQRIKNIKAAR
jgi:hypothetical protein